MAEGFRRMYSQLRTIPIDDVVGTSTNAGNVLMSAPKLTIKAEPFEGSALVYGALAARTTNDPPAGQLSLVLMITNNELMPVHLNQVAISFVGPPAASPSSIAADVIIGALQTTQWHFETNNNIILPVPAPGAVHIAPVVRWLYRARAARRQVASRSSTGTSARSRRRAFVSFAE
jgi:hypothetical protein